VEVTREVQYAQPLLGVKGVKSTLTNFLKVEPNVIVDTFSEPTTRGGDPCNTSPQALVRPVWVTGRRRIRR
jgi:hypothetical protein